MITSTLFSPLGDWIALACSNLGQLVVWEWQSQTYVLKQQGHFNNMTQLAYSPDGMHIASGGDDGKVSFFSKTKKLYLRLRYVDQIMEYIQWFLFCNFL
jgi:periodic tryptophan protein 2